MASSGRVSRRTILQVAGLAAAYGASPTAARAAATTQATTYQEAPMLAELVAAGQLPPVAERLPREPLVETPEDSVGTYGGQLRSPHAWDLFLEEGLATRLHSDRNTFIPQIAKSWEWAPDFTSITFSLRDGMRWSDGQPYTADDILFWWNDVAKSDLHSQPYQVAGMDLQTDNVVKVDDSTVRFEFSEPKPGFLVDTRGAWSYGFYGYPAHYFKTLHPAHNGTVPADAAAAFQEFLDRLYQNKWIYADPNAPTILAWRPIEYKQGQIIQFERNPYYYAVDPQGNQLPYIDRAQSLDLYDADAQVIKLKGLAGEADIVFRPVSVQDYPLFKEKEEEAHLQLITLDDVFNGPQAILFNQAYGSETEVTQVLQQADVRRAMSLAIDRDFINQSVYIGLGRPGHGFSAPGVFDDAIDGSYAAFDPDQANQLLDGAGLVERDGDGMRLLPSGEALSLVLVHQTNWGMGSDSVAGIVIDNWKEIGLRIVAKVADSRLYGQLVSSDDWQIRIRPGTGGWTGYWDFTLGLQNFARPQWDWVTSDGQSGLEPAGTIKELADLQAGAKAALDDAEQEQLYGQYRGIMAGELFEMAPVALVPAILVINADLRNVPGQTKPAAIASGESEYLRFTQWYFA